MLSLFWSHNFTSSRVTATSNELELGLARPSPLSFRSFCTWCGRVKTEFHHQYGACFDRDYRFGEAILRTTLTCNMAQKSVVTPKSG